MVQKTFKAHESPLSKVFCDDYLFQIPDYQRPYSWTVEEASELVDDIKIHFEEQDGNDDKSPYFLGSVVLIKGEDPKSDVIDGQQRLTTLTILFSVLWNLTGNDELNDPFLFQKGKSILGQPTEYRLSLRERDQEFFRGYIQEGNLGDLFNLKEKLNDSKENLKRNTETIYNELQGFSNDYLNKFSQFLLKNCFLVMVSTPDLDSAYRIFSVLNDRGLELKATDILKSRVIGSISKSNQAKFNQIWEDNEEAIGRDQFNELFSHIRMVHRKAKPKGTLVKEFQYHVNPNEDPEKFINNTLLPFSEAFLTIKSQNFDRGQEAETINKYLGWLNKIDNSDWVPITLLIFSKFKNDPQLILNTLKKLERLSYSMMIFRANINYRIKRYSELLTHIERENSPISEDSPIELTEEEKEKTIERLESDIYTVQRIRLPLLLKLDSLLSDGSAKYDYSVISVEHVLPQTPPENSSWLENFPEQEQINFWTHKLANLVLLSKKKNSAAKNFNFGRKKNEYFTTNKGTSPFALTSQVINKEEWTPVILKDRQEYLVETLKREWELN